MAEAIFKNYTEKLKLKFTVDSCGTASYHVGENPDKRAANECSKNGITMNHKARQIHHSDFVKFEYIFCMDEYNLADLKEIEPKDSKSKLQLFGEYDPNGVKIIGDPYYGDADGFKVNYDQIVRCTKAFLKTLGYNVEGIE
jgi:low molecular weight phosphotyrosine protein phosphatase